MRTVEHAEEARDRERLALEQSVELMLIGDTSSATSTVVAPTLTCTNTLWAMLVEDLADGNNGLPRDLRARIVSIGIGLQSELEDILGGRSKSFDDVIALPSAIRDGLL